MLSEPRTDAPPRRLEFHIIYRCVNRCRFCSEREHMAAFARHPAARGELEAILRRKRREGYEHVTFTGGEPTLYPRLWEVLRFARELGYRTFLISNGAALSLPAFAERALPFVDELCLSLHGPTARTHDAATGRPGSFARLRAAFDNAERQARAPFVFVNCVVHRGNVERLPAILSLALGWRKVKHVLFSNLAPEGGGLSGYETLAVRHSEIASRLPGLAAAAQGRGVTLRVFGVPLCALGGQKRLSNDLYYSPRVTVARAWLEDGRVGWFEEPQMGPTRERLFVAACRRCREKARCGGVFRRYAESFGVADLRPIGRARETR